MFLSSLDGGFSSGTHCIFRESISWTSCFNYFEGCWESDAETWKNTSSPVRWPSESREKTSDSISPTLLQFFPCKLQPCFPLTPHSKAPNNLGFPLTELQPKEAGGVSFFTHCPISRVSEHCQLLLRCGRKGILIDWLPGYSNYLLLFPWDSPLVYRSCARVRFS